MGDPPQPAFGADGASGVAVQSEKDLRRKDSPDSVAQDAAKVAVGPGEKAARKLSDLKPAW